MITVIARLFAKPGKESLLYEECRKIVKQVREKEPGCKMYIPHLSEINPAEIMFVEKYVDQEAVNNHLNTPHFKALAEKFNELLDGAPKLQLFKELE